jgi:chloride channel protein, CIC family
VPRVGLRLRHELVIAADLGAAFAGVVEHVWPNVLDRGDAIALILLGMVAFFSSAAKAPVSTLVMVVELTGITAIIFPGVWVAAIGFLLSGTWTIYREQVADRGESGAHGGVPGAETTA